MTADAVGGVWRYCLDLTAELVQRGAEVMLATMGPRPTYAERKELLSLPRVSLTESDFALEWMENPWHDVDAAGEWLLGLQASFEPDVVHLNGYAHASLAWDKPVIVVAHSCVYSWWRAVHGRSPGEEWQEYKRRVTRGLSACDRMVCPSAYMARELQNEYRVNPENLRVIHNFTRARVSHPSDKQPFLLAAGRVWDAAKNLELLDRIAPKLDWEVRIAGSGSPGHSARFLGSLSHAEMLDQMHAASIFVHPALYEPFGLSVLEAARSGCCLVLSDIPSLRELWDGAAMFIDAGNPDRWVRELNQLIQDANARVSLVQLAYAKSLTYSAASSTKQYLELYASLVEADAGVAA